ncbi:RTA1-domain-containing protein [Mollisia scopiformis]|uniref:RTA1-domain-containing protein n=1 Tax=Mollisia scopiformis TaxID=149040 RepID=A0A194XDN9_MOLSC|nr:RTA1-domain-containing protein [Mollisia scopiformis]KUJ18266.1 RTA1-domain-containing protein [Mollisia scopiformis]
MSNLTHSTGHGTGYGNATLLANPELCTLQTCDLSMASFLYLPTVPGNAIYAAIFGIYVIAQLYFGIRYRVWGYMVAMVLGLVAEIIGYVGRIMLHNSPFDNNDFLTYLICLTIAPALLSASIYLCLSRIVIVYGENLSRFKPRTYTAFFCTCDFICLVLQGMGGGIASTANTVSGSNLGKNIMLAGLIFQLISLSLFAVACTEFFFRVRSARGNWNPRYLNIVSSKLFKAFLFGLATATVTIFIRSVYRCAELSGGFNSTLFTSDEALFMILEGLMIVTATTCLTLLHPAVCFQGAWHEANFKFRTNKGESAKLYTSDEENQNSDVRLDDMSGRGNQVFQGQGK